MRVNEVMTSAVDLAGPEMPIREAAANMRDDNLGALPVGEDDRLIGMVTDRDIVARAISDGWDPDATVRNVLSEEIYYCFEDEALDRAGQLMAEHQIRRLPVLNRDKRLVGMVAVSDLARAGDDGRQAAMRAIGGVSAPSETSRQ